MMDSSGSLCVLVDGSLCMSAWSTRTIALISSRDKSVSGLCVRVPPGEAGLTARARLVHHPAPPTGLQAQEF